MLRNLILAVLCLMTISILFSNSGISPNGHRYNPRYVQCESFATVNEIKPNRDYEIPYLYTRDAQIRLVFEKPDCMPSYRDASISYSDAMLHDYTLSNVNMFAFNLNNIVVSNAGSGSFLTINAAMDFITDFLASGLYTGEPIRIKVSQETPETYVESVDLSPLASYNVTNFTLEGVGEVIIEGVITLNCSAGSMLQEAEYIIKGLNFTNSTQGIVFTDTWDDSLSEVHIPNIKLSIENCSIYACGTSLNISNWNETDTFSAAGIHFEGAGSIKNCSITDNTLIASSESYAQHIKSGAVFVLNNSNAAVDISNNTFLNNRGAVSGGIVVNGTSLVNISQNRFENNVVDAYCMQDYQSMQGNAISVFEAANVTISNNLLINNFDIQTYGGTGVYLENLSSSPQSSPPIMFMNNSIYQNLPPVTGNITRSLAFKYISSPASYQEIVTRNNIFTCSYASSGASVASVNGYSTPNLNNNIFHNTNVQGFQISTTDISHPRYNLVGNPQLDANYVPIWNSTTMSPCIDAGNPDTDGDGIPWNGDGVNFENDPDDIDSDGTCLDIGAIPAVQHDYEDYAMPVSGGIKWMSFPVLNRITNGYTTNSSFFNSIINPSILDWVEWKHEADQKTIMEYDDLSLLNGTQSVTSPVGYKLKLQSEVTNQIKLNTPGFIQTPTTSINLYKYQSETTTTNENWIGYFQRTSSHPFNAFASILDYVTSIRTQYWSMARMPKTGVWIMTPGIPVINYGDMVIVTVSQNCSFTWNNSVPVDPKVREKAVEFQFTEKPDYAALYLDLASLSEQPSEIGVYIDGICKGAVKVESNFTDICVYLEANEAISADNCELVFYYAPKSASDYRKTCKPKAEDLSQIAESGLNYYTMKLTSDSELNPVVPITALQQNYPNPFNPSTTIDYELAEEGHVSIDIYNVRGQKVTTLVNCAKVSGSHRVIWNGTDKYGRSVSSGIYHYRLTTKDKSITKKMLLLK